MVVVEAGDDPRVSRSTRISILQRFASEPPASDHDALFALLHTLRVGPLDALRSPTGLVLSAPLPAEHLISDKHAEAAAKVLHAMPLTEIWPTDTESAPSLYNISIDYGRSHYLLLDANDERDVQMVNDICYNKDPGVRAHTLEANRVRLGYTPDLCAAMLAQISGHYRNHAVARLKLDLVRQWMVQHSIQEPRATELAVRCMALSWQRPLRAMKALTWAVCQDLDDSWNMSLIVFSPVLVMATSGPALRVTMTNYIPDTGVWQVRNVIGAAQKRKIQSVWSVSLTNADDKGELRVYDMGEAEAMNDEQRKSFFGVWNSATKNRLRFYDTCPTW